MPIINLGEYLPLMFPNDIMLLLYTCALPLILTWALLNKHLNPFINSVLAILGCALEIIVTFIMLPISWTAKKIDIYISQPIQRLKKRIHIPVIVNATLVALMGVGVFFLDHKYNKYLFAFDETFPIYPMEINGMKFWVSEVALWVGGAFLGLSSLYIVQEILKSLNRLLDHPMKLHVTIYR